MKAIKTLAATLFLASYSTQVAAFVASSQRHSVTSTSTQLGISEALAHYIDQEYYRQTHKEQYNQNWIHYNKAAILYHTHEGELVLGDPHIDFHTHTERPETAQHYVAEHPKVRQHLCDIQEKIMSLKPHEFMRECHECVNRKLCHPANDYYEAFLAALKPEKRDSLAYAYTRGE